MEVINLSKSYDNRKLFSNLNFKIDVGLVLIKGPSGVGKTTLLKILMGLENPTQGEIIKSENEKYFSYAGQDDSLCFEFSLLENFRYLFGKKEDNRFNKLVELFHFSNNKTKKLYQLSGGERKKAELIICFYRQVSIYYLDEPFSGLDVETRIILQNYISNLSKRHLVFLVNHQIKKINLNYNLSIMFSDDNFNVVLGKKMKLHKNLEVKRYESKSFRLSMINYFKKNKLFIFIKSVILLACFLMMSLGFSYLDTKPNSKRVDISFKQDPFSYHQFKLEGKSKVDDSFFSDYYYQSIKVNYLNTSFYLFSFADDSSTSLQLYVNNNSSLNSLIGQDIFIYKQTILVEKLNLESNIISKMPRFYFLANIIDGYDKINSFGIVSKKIFDDFLLYKGEDKMSREFTYDLNFNLISRNYQYSSSKYNIKINSSNGLSIKVPKDLIVENQIGLLASFNNVFYYNADISSNKNEIELSSDMLKNILLLKNNSYYFIDSNRNIVNLIDIYSDINVIDYIFEDTSKFLTRAIMYLSLATAFIVAYFIFVCLSYKKSNKNYLVLKNIYLNNLLDISKLDIGLLLSISFEIFLPAIMFVILYPCLFINFSNYQLMIEFYDSRYLSYFYYSQQPNNPYYDNIIQPINFFTYEWQFLFILIIAICFIFLNYFLIKRKMQKTNRFHLR